MIAGCLQVCNDCCSHRAIVGDRYRGGMELETVRASQIGTMHLLHVWRRGIPQKCHPAVDLHSGFMDTWTTGPGSEKKTTTTQER